MKRILLFVLLIGALLVAMSTFHIGASPSETRATQALASSANNSSLCYFYTAYACPCKRFLLRTW